jgi:glycosyltransferase involved in cell wall biosynthesis
MAPQGARHILEPEFGVAYARRLGIQEASADLIVFDDDDNVLDKIIWRSR